MHMNGENFDPYKPEFEGQTITIKVEDIINILLYVNDLALLLFAISIFAIDSEKIREFDQMMSATHPELYALIVISFFVSLVLGGMHMWHILSKIDFDQVIELEFEIRFYDAEAILKLIKQIRIFGLSRYSDNLPENFEYPVEPVDVESLLADVDSSLPPEVVRELEADWRPTEETFQGRS